METKPEPTQQDLDIFVQHNVDCCQTSLVEAILAHGYDSTGGKTVFPTHEDIVNLYEYKCPECGQGEQDASAFENEKFCTGCAEDVKEYACPFCKKEFEDEPESNPQEILEWWLCDSWFLNRLEERGEAVLRSDLGDWWGRTCSGQSISLDSVIADIYKSLSSSNS